MRSRSAVRSLTSAAQRAAAVVPAFRQALGEDQRSKRLAQRLDNLERANYTGALSTKHQSFQPALHGLGVVDHEPEEKLDQETLNSVLGSHASSKRRKKTTQTQAVRTLLTYRHTLEELINQSVRPHLDGARQLGRCSGRHSSPGRHALILAQGLTTLSTSTPSYLTAVAPAPQTPPVQMCSICGYWGKHACNRCVRLPSPWTPADHAGTALLQRDVRGRAR